MGYIRMQRGSIWGSELFSREVKNRLASSLESPLQSHRGKTNSKKTPAAKATKKASKNTQLSSITPVPRNSSRDDTIIIVIATIVQIAE